MILGVSEQQIKRDLTETGIFPLDPYFSWMPPKNGNGQAAGDLGILSP